MMAWRRHLLEMVAGWDAPTRLSFTLAVALLAVAFGVLLVGPATLQLPALVAVVTLMTVLQGLVLWGNRQMVTLLTKAQRAYRQGEFDQVVALLAERAQADDADVAELTLLGNTYRQRGELSESEAVLFKAVNISPESYFPLYGFGRTLLVKGAYDRAAEMIMAAIANGAPETIRVDLAEAYFFAGQPAVAQAELTSLDVPLEPHRALMRDYILQRSLSPEDVEAAHLYWEQTAQRFAHTPYGQALQEVVSQMQARAEGDL